VPAKQCSKDPYQPFVLHMVGEAYATWWALSNGPSAGMEDYIDAKQYREGAQQARTKAITSK
jgi:hypothetical protein